MLTLLALTLCFSQVLTTHDLPLKLWVSRVVDSQIANIHLRHTGTQLRTSVCISYGTCHSTSPSEAHHQIRCFDVDVPSRLVWHVPDSIEEGGCLSAWNTGGALIGRSNVILIDIPRLSKQVGRRLRKRQESTSVAMDDSNGIDNQGPWFDGVAVLQGTGISAVDINAAKSKQIAIVGGGMAGLMTWLILDEAGFTNLTIIES